MPADRDDLARRIAAASAPSPRVVGRETGFLDPVYEIEGGRA